jgi:hypothetical protein
MTRSRILSIYECGIEQMDNPIYSVGAYMHYKVTFFSMRAAASASDRLIFALNLLLYSTVL